MVTLSGINGKVPHILRLSGPLLLVASAVNKASSSVQPAQDRSELGCQTCLLIDVLSGLPWIPTLDRI